MNLNNPALRGVCCDSEGIKGSCYDYPKDVDKSSCCTRLGVYGKTLLLLGIAFVSAILSIVVFKNILVEGDGDMLGKYFVVLGLASIVTVITALICIFVPGAKVSAIIYSISEGILLGAISLICDIYIPGVAFLAMILTFGITVIMAILYFTGLIKPNAKLKAFVFTLLISVVVLSVFILVCSLCNVEGIKGIFFGTDQYGALGWIVSIALLLIVSLLLIFDFDTATNCVTQQMEKKYEWVAAFGLSYDVLYLYLRVLELLVRIAMASSKK